MKHELPDLPYAYNTLEPYYEERTLKLHHGAHHKAYVDGLTTPKQNWARPGKKATSPW
jgi:Fe-Mn family superoxide dismutase